MHRVDWTLKQFAAFAMLLVMLTLLVGKSLHVCPVDAHYGSLQASSTTSDDSVDHYCTICKFELSIFDKVDEPLTSSFISLISVIDAECKQDLYCFEQLSHSDRGPPQSIV